MLKTTKQCFKCSETKPITDFYKHKKMSDGHVNKCKECNKNDVRVHRDNNIDRIRRYDRNRPNAIERAIDLRKRTLNMTNEERKQRNRKNNLLMRNNPQLRNQKTVAAYLNNAVRDGRIHKLDFCEHCGDYGVAIDGHHPSYLNPLEVIWLCKPCHGKEHKKINERKRSL